MRHLQRFAGTMGVAALLAATACQSLDVKNPNEPDAKRALGDPGTVLSIAGGTMRTWLNTAESMESSGPLTTMADNYTASWNNFNMRIYSSEPRDSWKNDPAATARTSVEAPWYGYYGGLSSANDVLTAIRKLNLKFDNADDSTTAETMALFSQGLMLGELSLLYDKAFVVDENTDLSTLEFSTRQQVRDAALVKLDSAIAMGRRNSFSTPAAWFGGARSYTSHEVAQMAATEAARVLAYHPRTAAEKAQVDWARVKTYADSGVTFDVVFKGDGGCPDITGSSVRGFCDEEKLWGEDPTTMRVDTRLAHLMDPVTQHTPWPDPTGNGQPNSADARLGNGAVPDCDWAGDVNGVCQAGAPWRDFMYNTDAIFRPARGQYHQSNITHIRYVAQSFLDPAQSGGGYATTPVMTKTENDLLRAQALIETNQLGPAATLINLTRVGRGQLAPATAGDGKVGLYQKLNYEQQVELVGISYVTFFVRRQSDDITGVDGLNQGLQAHTPREMPVPAKELGVLRQAYYTFGGTFPDMGGASTASLLSAPVPASSFRQSTHTSTWSRLSRHN